MSEPDPEINDPIDPEINDPIDPEINDPIDPEINDPVTNDVLTNDSINDPVTIDIIELSTPDPILLQSQAAVIICIGRLNEIDKIKDFLFEHGFTEESIVVLKEDDQDKMPTQANITKYLQIVAGHSATFTKIWIYYCGQGIDNVDCLNKTINLSETISPFDFLRQSCCETVCLLDMSCSTPNIDFKWGIDVSDNVKIVTFCESLPSDSVGRARAILA